VSNHVSSEVCKRLLGSATRKALLALMADKASDYGTGIWASKQTMADELEVSKQTVITTIKGLVAMACWWRWAIGAVRPAIWSNMPSISPLCARCLWSRRMQRTGQRV
jgi:hypothetical protein